MYEEELKEIKDDVAKISKVTYEYQNYVKAKAIRIRDIIIGILLVLFLVSNIAWIIHESKMETVKETTETVSTETVFDDIHQEADNDGSNTIIGGDYYGETKDKTD